VTINHATGVATSSGNTSDQFAALAFNSSGTLFAVEGDKKNAAGGGLASETLFALNTSNAAPTQVLVLGRGNDREAMVSIPMTVSFIMHPETIQEAMAVSRLIRLSV
jgi:hypothetical protein